MHALFNTVLAEQKQYKYEGLELFFAEAPDQERLRNLAAILTSMALDFVTIHELSHIILGHLEFLETTDTDGLEEVASETEPNVVNAAQRQALECEADSIALNAISRLVGSLHLFRPGIQLAFDGADRYHLVAAYTCAIDIVVKVFLATNARYSALSGTLFPAQMLAFWRSFEHPHPFIRAMFMKQTWTKRIGARQGWDEARLGDAIKLGTMTANTLLPNPPKGGVELGLEVMTAISECERIEKVLGEIRGGRQLPASFVKLGRDLSRFV